MNRFWHAPRGIYSRTSLFPAGKNSKKPDKVIGPDGKLAEDSTDTREIVENIKSGLPVKTPRPHY